HVTGVQTCALPIYFTDFQYEYGQGEYGIRNETLADVRRTGVWSFGPRFDGEPIMQHDGVERPYLPNKNRIRDFYRLANTFTHSLAVSRSVERRVGEDCDPMRSY